jgi:hypothetical protein
MSSASRFSAAAFGELKSRMQLSAGVAQWSDLAFPVMTDSGAGSTRTPDGRSWRIGTERDVEWIRVGTGVGLSITSAIPPVFEAYATITLPDDEQVQQLQDRLLLQILAGASRSRPWWLGYLDSGTAEVVFPDAPLVTLYADWRYVIVNAGPEQARSWRPRSWKGGLPDLVFPEDRSWLLSTLWDDDWRCLGGPTRLIDSVVVEVPSARRVDPYQDATPPGHVAY